MGQNIKIRISERDYHIKAPNQEYEEYIRKAADDINHRIRSFRSQYQENSLRDILVFTALNIGVASLFMEKHMEDLKKEIETLKNDTDNYLKSIEK